MIAELKRILAVIPVNPEFHYIDEGNPNAFALPTSDLPGTKGTVLLGLKLINSLLQEQPDGGAAIAGVCAHECAHIYQYTTEFYDRLSGSGPILLELHADLIAGFYMGKRADVNADRVRSFSRALFERSGYDYTNPNYHGSPGQRLVAVEKGYFYARQGLSLQDATTRGETYVKNL